MHDVNQRITSTIILGGGSAGLLAALTLKRKIPALRVEVIYSSKIGVIGVGEGTTPYVPHHLLDYLRFNEHELHQAIDPVFKLGIRFAWGKATHFDYTFSQQERAYRHPELTRNHGFYLQDPTQSLNLHSELMNQGKAAPLRADGTPDLPKPGENIAWHLENHRFVEWLEKACRQHGVFFTDAELDHATIDATGQISELHLHNGSKKTADLFIDCSGFTSELLGKTHKVPFRDFGNALFCDRAVAGGWDRDDEPVLPYTASDTMLCGWSWRIDHPERIHRGYVYASDHLSDEAAIDEYRSVAPKVKDPRIVKFRSGAYQESWIGNTIAIGNAAGFVEPLEATALMVICLQCRWITDGLLDSTMQPTPSMVRLYNKLNHDLWTSIRDFLALHYRYNDRLDHPFWQRCRHETPLGNAEELVAFYKENGPSSIAGSALNINDPFGLDGYYAILNGLMVEHQRPYQIPEKERIFWQRMMREQEKIATHSLTMPQLRELLQQAQVWKKIRYSG